MDARYMMRKRMDRRGEMECTYGRLVKPGFSFTLPSRPSAAWSLEPTVHLKAPFPYYSRTDQQVQPGQYYSSHSYLCNLWPAHGHHDHHDLWRLSASSPAAGVFPCPSLPSPSSPRPSEPSPLSKSSLQSSSSGHHRFPSFHIHATFRGMSAHDYLPAVADQALHTDCGSASSLLPL